ncbi:MAG: hypothetical protein O3A46_14810, partial [Candidatus Poribacteria bacterium]|nr:hypothetical protein [Candidatus Poribacteria bacterium]
MTKLCAALIALSAVSCIAWAESDAMVWTVGLKGGFFSPSLDGEERLYGDSPYGAVEVAVRVPSGVFFRLESGYREDSGQFSTGFFANIDSESSEWRS